MTEEEKLEKENTELKERNRELLESCEGATMMYKDLCKAKELLKRYVKIYVNPYPEEEIELRNEAEQFLKETAE